MTKESRGSHTGGVLMGEQRKMERALSQSWRTTVVGTA